MLMKKIKVVVTKDNVLLFGQDAEKEIRDYPEEIIFTGEIEGIYGVSEAVKFALKESPRIRF